MKVRLLYISVSGNTRAFVKLLQEVAQADERFELEPVEISDASLDTDETTPYFAMVPTYLDGGNGIDNGVHEIMTNALYDQLAIGDNAKTLLGVIGSGNKNFNAQYVLTARRYAQAFNAPLIADYELRGTPRDAQRVWGNIVQRLVEAGY